MKLRAIARFAVTASAALLMMAFMARGVSAASDIMGGLKSASGDLAGKEQSIGGLAATIINGLLTLIGTLVVVLFIYGGYTWMTSGGDSKKVQKAQDILRNAVIGLIIVVSSWALTTFVLARLIGATTGGGGAGQCQAAACEQQCVSQGMHGVCYSDGGCTCSH